MADRSEDKPMSASVSYKPSVFWRVFLTSLFLMTVSGAIPGQSEDVSVVTFYVH